MIRKSMISATAVAVLAITTALTGTTAASAGGYGYGYKHGHHKKIIIKVPAAIGWKQHVAWCHDRYRSYRDWDNTFKPHHGHRQQCWSPYYRG